MVLISYLQYFQTMNYVYTATCIKYASFLSFSANALPTPGPNGKYDALQIN